MKRIIFFILILFVGCISSFAKPVKVFSIRDNLIILAIMDVSETELEEYKNNNDEILLGLENGMIILDTKEQFKILAEYLANNTELYISVRNNNRCILYTNTLTGEKKQFISYNELFSLVLEDL